MAGLGGWELRWGAESGVEGKVGGVAVQVEGVWVWREG